jgi:hypothetical protein
MSIYLNETQNTQDLWNSLRATSQRAEDLASRITSLVSSILSMERDPRQPLELFERKKEYEAVKKEFDELGQYESQLIDKIIEIEKKRKQTYVNQEDYASRQ